VAVLGTLLLLWLPSIPVRHPRTHAPAVIRFEPPMHASPPVKSRILLPPKVA
jgi:hypothetical protein